MNNEDIPKVVKPKRIFRWSSLEIEEAILTIIFIAVILSTLIYFVRN